MARSFVAASSNKITLPGGSSSVVTPRSVLSITIRFKYSDSGSTRQTLYSEDEAGSQCTLHVSLNDTVNGRIRAICRDNSSNTPDMTWDGNLDDGQDHCATYVRRAFNDHELFVDGASRATSTTNLAGTFDAITSQGIGFRNPNSAGAASFYNGEASDLILHSVALTLAQHTTLWDKSKHAFNATSTAGDVMAYWPLHNVGGDVRNVRETRLNDAPATLSGTTAVDGPDGAGPTGMVETTDLGAMLVAGGPTTTLITGGGTSTDGDYLVREPGNTIHDPTDATRPYKIYYAGTPNTYAANDPSIFMAFATDLAGSWTKYGEVIPNSTLPLEDPYVVIDPATGTYHMWAENKTGKVNTSGIAHLTSTDYGITWSVENATAIDNGSGGAWDDQDVASPIVWLESGTWYMLFEGRKVSGQNGQMGLATASSPNGSWTKSGSNPVMVERSAKWDSEQVVCDEIVKIGSTYYVGYHASNGTYTGNGVASSTNLTTWTRSAQCQLTGRSQTNTFMRMGGLKFSQLVGIMEAGPPGRDFTLFRGWGDPASQTSEWPETVGGAAVAYRPGANFSIGSVSGSDSHIGL